MHPISSDPQLDGFEFEWCSQPEIWCFSEWIEWRSWQVSHHKHYGDGDQVLQMWDSPARQELNSY